MSSSISHVAKDLRYIIENPVFKDDSLKGYARISFLMDDRVVHRQNVKISKSQKESKIVLIYSEKIHGLQLKGSLEMTEASSHTPTYYIKPERLETAAETALGILGIY